MHQRHITVVPFQPQWAMEYRKEAQKMKRILEEILIEIHHIGSTSVVGLSAKPIIDIMPVVTSIHKVDEYNQAFEALGYTCMGEYGIPGRRFFLKGEIDRTHHIHVFEQSNHIDIERHLALRDYLWAHSEVASEYGMLKSRLATQFPYDIEGYCEGKDAFVKQMEYNALQWCKKQRKDKEEEWTF